MFIGLVLQPIFIGYLIYTGGEVSAHNTMMNESRHTPAVEESTVLEGEQILILKNKRKKM